jgi:serine/threonine protein kinase
MSAPFPPQDIASEPLCIPSGEGGVLLSPEARDIIERMLSKDATCRPVSVQELLDHPFVAAAACMKQKGNSLPLDPRVVRWKQKGGGNGAFCRIS